MNEAGTANCKSNERAIREWPDCKLEEYLDQRRRLVDEGISRFLSRHYQAQVREIADYLVQGGKRLRGVLTILVCEAFGGRAEDALGAAVAVELAHAASLAHDDVMDSDTVRRKRPALHVRYDLATAILVPHLLVPHSILSAQVYGPGATSVILQGWAQIVRGQMRDCVSAFNGGLTRPQVLEQPLAIGRLEYFRIIRDKTAALFETAAVLGAIAARDDREAATARSYARQFGIAFQVADDVTDLEAHRSEPWSKLLNAETTSRSIRAIARIVSLDGEDAISSGVIARARNLAAVIARRAADRAAAFPISPLRELLRGFPSFAVNQIYAEAQEAVFPGAEEREAT